MRPESPLHTNPYEFRYLTEFQSHEPEFDYLKSLEIEEKINKVRWVKGRCGGRTHMLLTTNDKTVKLWKVRTAGDWLPSSALVLFAWVLQMSVRPGT